MQLAFSKKGNKSAKFTLCNAGLTVVKDSTHVEGNTFSAKASSPIEAAQ